MLQRSNCVIYYTLFEEKPMKPIVTIKDFIDQQYEMQKRLVEAADKATATATDLFPKMPTPAEVIDSAIEINKFYGKFMQDELTNTAKQFYKFK
jgi:phage host-nuclease inhibitor protein Gam